MGKRPLAEGVRLEAVQSGFFHRLSAPRRLPSGRACGWSRRARDRRRTCLPIASHGAARAGDLIGILRSQAGARRPS
jgi:hypothetical protein